MGALTSHVSVFSFHAARPSIAPRVGRVRTCSRFCASSPAVQPQDSALQRRRRAWAGLTLSIIARAFPGAGIDGHLHADALDVSGGEALAAAYRRASTALLQLVSISRAAPVVVVSHGVINALLMCAAVGQVPTHMDQYTQPNGCTYRLQFRRSTLITVDCARVVACWSNAAISHSFPWHVTS